MRSGFQSNDRCPYQSCKSKMDVKWLPATLSAALWDGEKRSEHKDYQDVTDIAITIQGQQTVQEIVSKATELFRYLRDVKLSAVAATNKVQKAEVQELLKSLREQFTKLRTLYDESTKRVDASFAENLEADIPMAMNEPELLDMKVTSEKSSLQIEHDKLEQKLRAKNQHIKILMDSIRTLIWDINTMLALKPT